MRTEQHPEEHGGLEDSLLGDPSVAQTVAEDPLFIFLRRWGRQLLMITALVLAGYFGNGLFQKSYTDSMRRYADVFASLRVQLAEIEGLRSASVSAREESAKKASDAAIAQEEKDKAATAATKAEDDLKQAQSQLNERLTALADARSPYAEIAAIYRGIVRTRSGDLQEARAAFGSLKWRELKADDSARFFGEMAAFGLAGALLESDASHAEGRQLLIDLARDGVMAHVAAALRLARLAQTEAERQEVLTILEALNNRYPEQNALLESEIKQLAGSI